MGKLNRSKHWTSESIENFVYRVASDFLSQLEVKIENGEISRSELANRLDRTPGRVSQLFDPGNMTLSSAVKLARAMDMKVAVVAYDDDDPTNYNGPINSAIFSRCWKHMGSPATFFELAHSLSPVGYFGISEEAKTVDTQFKNDLRIRRSAQTLAIVQ